MSNLEERQALIGEMAEHLKKNIYHSEERKITTPRKEYQAESQKVVSLEEAIRRSGLKDGMTVSFHHHFRGGDKVLNMVMDKIAEMGIKDLHVAASSLNDVHKPLIEHIKNGVVTRISTSGMRGELAKAISHGILKEPVVFRSHGGRGSAIANGDIHIDVAFLGASSCDPMGNSCGFSRSENAKSICGSLGYALPDARYADHVVILTDDLVSYPNTPTSISEHDVDWVVVVDSVGDSSKIASGAIRDTKNPRDILLAKEACKVIVNSGYFKEGFSYQTGVGGASIASTISLSKIMEEKNIHMGLGVGGLTKPMCELLDRGLARKLVDTQDFDLDAVNNVRTNPNHFPISAGEYASPMNKGAFVNKLDYVILASLEVDTHFNCNVVVGSDGIITGAQGGHPDTAQGAKCTIVIAPLLQGRIPAICTDVTTVTTPGESVDIVVTDYGVAVNPRRPDLLEALKAADCVPLKTIEELRDIAYSIVGEPEKVQFGDRIVGIIEARDGTVMDVVREVKPFSFRED